LFPKGDTPDSPAAPAPTKTANTLCSICTATKASSPGIQRDCVAPRHAGGGVVPANDPTPPIESQASESLPPHLSNRELTKITVRVTTEKVDYDLDLK